MSDSLRDALEKLADSWERRPVKEAHSYPEANAYVDGQNDTYERSADVLRDLLSAHPAEPVGVSDVAQGHNHRDRCCCLTEPGDQHHEPSDTCPACTKHGGRCTCGFGGFHDDKNERCDLFAGGAE